MERKSGKSIYHGIAIGRIKYYEKGQQVVKRVKIENVDDEIRRYERAKQVAVDELEKLYEKAVIDVGESNAMIFDIHAMMLDDKDYNDSVYNIIKHDGVNAEFAVATTGDNFSRMFAEMEDEYFKARASDVKDITERVLKVLGKVIQEKDTSLMEDKNIYKDDKLSCKEESYILVAEDLAPSETVQMDKSKLLGFITKYGSANSHTAILARTMNIPALMGVDISRDWDGKMAVIDGKR
ncbi:MAG: phosphoenolpyruvate--protein phosphotransferase, partial [Lachnospiraceae bacterium]|nr:phosphoenolpyruvate--protein phosphotransferase [Lachnospiraceae bacterium]